MQNHQDHLFGGKIISSIRLFSLLRAHFDPCIEGQIFVDRLEFLVILLSERLYVLQEHFRVPPQKVLFVQPLEQVLLVFWGEEPYSSIDLVLYYLFQLSVTFGRFEHLNIHLRTWIAQHVVIGLTISLSPNKGLILK